MPPPLHLIHKFIMWELAMHTLDELLDRLLRPVEVGEPGSLGYLPRQNWFFSSVVFPSQLKFAAYGAGPVVYWVCLTAWINSVSCSLYPSHWPRATPRTGQWRVHSEAWLLGPPVMADGTSGWRNMGRGWGWGSSLHKAVTSSYVSHVRPDFGVGVWSDITMIWHNIKITYTLLNCNNCRHYTHLKFRRF